MSASSRFDLDADLNRNDQICIIEGFKDGNFPALRPEYDRNAHAHHMATGHNAPHNSVPEHLTCQIQTQINRSPQHFTQPHNMTTHFYLNNTLPRVKQTPQTQSSDSSNPINNLAGRVAGIASQQRPQTSSAIFKPTRTNTLLFDGRNKKFELFEDLFRTMHRKQPEKTKAKNIHRFHSLLRNDALQTFRSIFASNKRTLEDVLIIFWRSRQTTITSHG